MKKFALSLIFVLATGSSYAQDNYGSYNMGEMQHQTYGSSRLDNAAYSDMQPAYAPAEGYSDHPQAGEYASQPTTYNKEGGKTSYSSLTIPSAKGEILIHRPAPIIVKRPPTKVLVNHPPLVVKPAPVVLHKPPPVVVRKVFVKHHPRPVKVEPVYVNVVKPPAEKYYVNEKPQSSCKQCNKAPQPDYQPQEYQPQEYQPQEYHQPQEYSNYHSNYPAQNYDNSYANYN